MFSQRFDPLSPPPLNDLQGSVEKLIQWSAPLLSEEEVQNSRLAANSFLKSEGKALQEELNRLRSEGEKVLDLVPYWKGWYLKQRDALPVNVNPFYLFDPKSVPEEDDFCRLAARLALGAVSFCTDLDKGAVPQDTFKGSPLCMKGYDHMFRSSRGAFPGRDQIIKGDPRSTEGRSLLVMTGGFMHLVPVLSKDGVLRGLDDLTTVLRGLVDGSPKSDPLPIGLITCPPRDEAAALRSTLTKDEHNDRNLKQVEGALFVLCLDGECGEGLKAGAEHFLFDQGRNRWFEKSFQLIVTSDGRSGINFEHSSRDGTHVGPLVREIQGRSFYPFSEEAEMEKTTELKFNLSQDMRDRLSEIKEYCKELRNSLIQRPFIFDLYGKAGIKEAGVSPDAFVQIAILLAQKDIWTSWRSVYESVQMRSFEDGRTEGTRPLTDEAAAFLDGLEKGEDRDSLKALLEKASDAHKGRIALCMEGKAPEGHLALLRQVWVESGQSLGIDREPDIFLSPAWLKMTKNYISTSTTPGKGLTLAGYGPVEPGGISGRYLSRPDRLIFHIGSWSCDGDLAERFVTALDNALRRMGKLFVPSMR